VVYARSIHGRASIASSVEAENIGTLSGR